MKIIAIISQKGGAGKTTLALNLAVAMKEKGKEVAIIDLDQQASSSAWGDSREDESPVVVSAHAARLPQLIEKCKSNGADFLVLDTAPHAESQALAAARIADLVLIPCRPSLVDLRAINSSINVAEIAKTEAYVVISQTPARGSLAAEARIGAKELGAKVAPVEIGNRVAFVNSITKGKGVTEFEPNGKAAEEIGKLLNFINKKLGAKNDKEK